MFYAAIATVAFAAFFYWRSQAVTAGERILAPSIGVVLLALGMISLVVLLDRTDRWRFSNWGGKQPIALAIVFDTSLSMYAGPDPTRLPRVNTRLDRGKEVVLEVLHRLDKDQRSVLASLIVFTVRAANVLGWNPNLREVGLIIDRALTTNLIGRGGTDLGGALARSVEVFDTLPEREEASAKKVMLLVSDGERTLNMVDLEENLNALQQRNITIVALQVGLLDEPEGIREYDEFGFTGFWKGAGETFTVPDTNTMVNIAGRNDKIGYYIRAEDPQASRRILGFLEADGGVLPETLTLKEVMTLGLWLFSIVTLRRLLA